MINKKDTLFRCRSRYDHVSLLLWVIADDDVTTWKRIRVNDWNEKGFNFHFDQEISSSELLFKDNSRSEFSGNLVWTLRNDDERAILEVILNHSIVRDLKRFHENSDLIGRALSMVRTKGLVDEKKKLLAYLGCEISPEDEYLLIQSYKMKYPCYRYGVRVESDAWLKTVTRTLDLTSVVDTLDRLDTMIEELRHQGPFNSSRRT